MDFAGADMGSERRRRYVSATAIRAFSNTRYLVIQKVGGGKEARNSNGRRDSINSGERTGHMNSTKRGASAVM